MALEMERSQNEGREFVQVISQSKDKKMARSGSATIVQQVMVIQTCSLKNVHLQWVFIFTLRTPLT